MKTKDVAELSQVPREYLAKIVQLLARGKVIESKKGRGGGICLARDTKSISLFDVVDVVDPIRHYEHCPFKLQEHKGGLCPLHRRLEGLIQGIVKEFKCTSLHQIVEDSKTSSALCDFDKEKAFDAFSLARQNAKAAVVAQES
jgi:Rrf2 family iron-sulfur cluster assembly transcriptional regulator